MTNGSYPRQQQTIFDIVDQQVEIPEKLYFKIGEVCSLTGIKQHVLRYWEKEFSSIRPFRGPSKQRLYRRKDVETVFAIKKLLHEERYTIAGAKKHLAKGKKAEKEQLIRATTKATKAAEPKKAGRAESKSATQSQAGRNALVSWIKSELIGLQMVLERRR